MTKASLVTLQLLQYCILLMLLVPRQFLFTESAFMGGTPSIATRLLQTSESPSTSRNRRRTLLFQQNDRRSKPPSGTSTTTKRWVGNTKPSIKKLSDIPKAKKHTLEVTTKMTTTSKAIKTTTKILEKKKYESLQHVLTKALIWKLFQEDYPNILIEEDIGDPDFLPDVISLNDGNDTENPLLWGESGRMSLEKALELAQRYPNTHIVHLRWGMTLNDYVPDYAPALQKIVRPARYTFGAIAKKEVWDYFRQQEMVDGAMMTTVEIESSDVEWLELEEHVK